MSTPNGSQCTTIQILEPDSTLLTATQSGAVDEALDERGAVVLTAGQTDVAVTFNTQKLSDQYRFEFSYVDAFGLTNPGVISVVPVIQTVAGFTLKLAGDPPQAGYILRWRVVVESSALGSAISPPVQDTPETIYDQLSMSSTHTHTFSSPRSTQDYGFSELRIENLIDLPGEQTPILAQVVAKTVDSFTVALSPTPNNNNYYLAARTP